MHLQVLLLTVGCVRTPSPDADRSDAETEPSRCVGPGFQPTAVGATLPTIDGEGWFDLVPWPERSGQGSREDEGVQSFYRWDVRDLNGDALPDLVVTLDERQPSVGADHWDVYEGTGSGFAATASPWPLPSRSGAFWSEGAPWDDTEARVNHSVGEIVEHYSWSTMDLTNDGLPDLVVMGDYVDLRVGLDHWEVYEGTGAGFSASSTTWALPSIAGSEWARTGPWNEASGHARRLFDGEYTDYSWSTLDLTGDGLFDLALTRDDADPTIGSDHWYVYEGTAAGFALVPARWALPSIAGAEDSELIFDTKDEELAYRYVGDEVLTYSWATVDLTADGLVDLVLTHDGADPSVGDQRWLVYQGTGAGFASTPAPWTLPAIEGEGWAVGVPWYWTHTGTFRTISEGPGFYNASTFDLSGDGALDLVLTLDGADPSVGAERWLLYEGAEWGFEETATTWALPELDGMEFESGAPWYTTDAEDWADREIDGVKVPYSWSTMDLTGDAVPDLVLTSDDANLTVGREYWALYAGCP
jgi:hypothetical protein